MVFEKEIPFSLARRGLKPEAIATGSPLMVFEKEIRYALARLGLKPAAIGAGSPLQRAQGRRADSLFKFHKRPQTRIASYLFNLYKHRASGNACLLNPES